jgi:hypothetical protein
MFQLPFFITNQYRSISIDNLLNNNISYISFLNQTSPGYLSYNWGYAPVSGDSGSAVFTSINGQLVTIGTWWQSGPWYESSDIAYYYNDTNTAITAIGSTYQLASVDLTSFPSY